MSKKNKHQGGVRIPLFIIYLSKFLQVFSADLTVKFVRYLFQKPFNHKVPEPERELLKSAEISYLDIPEIRKKIAVYQWKAGDKKALLVHGWSGRATQMFKLINELLKNGYTVISFDAPAHGKSTGSRTMMPEFIKTVEKISEKFGNFDVGIGHSMGGITLLNVQGEKHLFKKLVVIGTPDSIFNIFNGFVKKLELKPIIAEKLIAVFEKITGRRIFDFHGSNQAKKIEEPVFIVHDEYDKEVLIGDALNNYKHLKNGKLLQTKGLGHTRILKDEKVVNEIIKFVNE